MWPALWKIKSGLQCLIEQEDGQDLVEYALVILLCVTVMIASVGSIGTIVINYFHYINTNYP